VTSTRDTDRPVAVVTGAAGDLGTTIVARLVADGFRVAALDRTDDLAARAGAVIGTDHVRGFAADQTDPEQVDAVVTEIAATLGTPVVAVANAGYAKFGALEGLPYKTFRRHVDVNLIGTFLICQAVAKRMIEARTGGSLIVVSSSLALAHADQVVPYVTTKAALLPLVRGLAAEFGTYDIRVNAILPGVVETAMTHEMLDNDGVRDDLLRQTPLGRAGKPDDIAAGVAFLASDQATWVTGAELSIDGGQSIYGQPQWIRQDRSIPGQPSWGPGLGTSITTTEE
jgi:NAD(P)-dependent dehydrogenase (short-subunit alcohol dehydrogenase family)